VQIVTIKKQQSIFNDIRFIEQYSSVVRFTYNRIIKDNIIKASELEHIVKSTMNNIELLDASFIKCAVKKASELNRDEKIYFGSKKEFFNKKYHRKNTYNKNTPISVRGETSKERKGNRKATLDILNNMVIFKPKKGIQYEIPLQLSKGEKNNLYKLQLLCEEGKGYFNFMISEDSIWISYDPSLISETVYESKKDRYLGLDLNPNYIGLSIMDINHNNKVEVYKEIIDLRKLNESNTNKKNYETVTISKHIISLCKHYHIECVGLENLNMKSKNHKKGKKLNRLLNSWNRNSFVNNLKKRLTLNSIKFKEVRPEYSSFIGQLENPLDYDSVAASKEIAYRSFLLSKGLNEYNSINRECMNLVPTRWKEMVPEVFTTFKDLYYTFKKKKLLYSYRVLYDSSHSSSSLNSYRSMVDLIRL
jgi:IS605 OrfB family transposase